MPYPEPWLSARRNSACRVEAGKAERLYRADRPEGFGTAPERRNIVLAIPEKAKDAR